MRLIRRGSYLLAWLGLIILTAWTWATPPIADEPDWQALGVSRSESLVYRTEGSRRVALEVYRPARAASEPVSGRRAAVIAIHGGSWIGGSMTSFRYDPGKIVPRLAQSGLVVFAIDYRLARPGSPGWPSVMDDLREAVRWVRRHGREFGVDPGRIAAVGQASGGHLATLLATLPDEKGPDGVSSRVEAVVNLYGPSDLVDLMSFRHLAHEPARAFLGDAADGSNRAAVQASPLEQLTAGAPPMLLIHGDDDSWVPVDQSERMANALDRLGVPHRLIVIHGARHGFETALATPVTRDLIPEITEFLEECWATRTE